MLTRNTKMTEALSQADIGFSKVDIYHARSQRNTNQGFALQPSPRSTANGRGSSPQMSLGSCINAQSLDQLVSGWILSHKTHGKIEVVMRGEVKGES